MDETGFETLKISKENQELKEEKTIETTKEESITTVSQAVESLHKKLSELQFLRETRDYYWIGDLLTVIDEYVMRVADSLSQDDLKNQVPSFEVFAKGRVPGMNW